VENVEKWQIAPFSLGAAFFLPVERLWALIHGSSTEKFAAFCRLWMCVETVEKIRRCCGSLCEQFWRSFAVILPRLLRISGKTHTF